MPGRYRKKKIEPQELKRINLELRVETYADLVKLAGQRSLVVTVEQLIRTAVRKRHSVTNS